MSTRARYSLIVFGLLIGLFLLEGLLRLYFALPYRKLIGPEDASHVDDARLGVRGNPAYPGNDARGWRNAVALDHAAIVALGDSTTYGYNASRDDAWPQRLGAIVYQSVYQMAIGGYGPGEYLLLFEEAIALKPKVIVATYHLGNDLWDAYSLAYRIGNHKDVSADQTLESFMSSDPKIRESIRRAEAIDPRLQRTIYLDCIWTAKIPGRSPILACSACTIFSQYRHSRPLN